MSEEQTPEKTSPKRSPVMLSRIGNVQALVEVRGEGAQQAMVARFAKILAPGEDPTVAQVFTMAEVAVIRHICDRLLDDAYTWQTRVLTPAAPPGETTKESA